MQWRRALELTAVSTMDFLTESLSRIDFLTNEVKVICEMGDLTETEISTFSESKYLGFDCEGMDL